MGKILLVDDDVRLVTAFTHILSKRGHRVVAVATAEEFLRTVENDPPELVILDVHLPGASGLDAFRKIKDVGNPATVIVMTGESTMQNAVEAMALGAFSYQLKPFDPEEMLLTIQRGLEDFRLRQEFAASNPAVKEPSCVTLTGRSAPMQEIYKSIGRVAPTETTVLIRGESGSGKELVARVIHQYSRRSHGPFVAINCSAIPETLLESELFGHEKGAFTGADSRRIGRFEQARGGTLFLDEIGDFPPGVQSKILRVLQERVFSRVGGDETIGTDVRVLSATNRNLELAVRSGKFREDLLYRLNVVTILVPPLRNRREDIPILVGEFTQRFALEFQVSPPVVLPEAMDVLINHDWPGNVRELQHCICRAMVFHPGAVLHREQIQTALGAEHHKVGPNSSDAQDLLRNAVRSHLLTHGGGRVFDTMTEKVESLLLCEALRLASGNQTSAAKLLGLARQTFRWKLSHHLQDLSPNAKLPAS